MFSELSFFLAEEPYVVNIDLEGSRPLQFSGTALTAQ